MSAKKDNRETAIKVKNLHKTFKIPIEGAETLKKRFINYISREKGYKEFSPLNGISFEIKKGDFFGIVGRNGSGKSTLLKTIAGIYEPNQGAVEVNGTLVPFIELGVGFNPELTGRENVYLSGALLGFSREDMLAMYDDIVDFAELEEFMDEKLKNYSSGMQVRLAFSIAIRARGDILLLDEVLAVGDEAFQRKCYSYFNDLKLRGETVVLVTHSMSAVERFCNRAMLIEGGEVKKIGTSSEISELYSNLFLGNSNKANQQKNAKQQLEDDDAPINIKDISIKQGGKKTSMVKFNRPFSVSVTLSSKEYEGAAAMGVNIINSQGKIVLATGIGGIRDTEKLKVKKGKNEVVFSVEQNLFTDDEYFINIAAEDDKGELIFKKQGLANFSIRGVKNRKQGMFHPEVGVKVNYEAKK